MKKVRLIIMLAIVNMLLLNTTYSYAVGSSMLITAHRGSSLHYPENTLISIEKAIEEGADYIEIDVRLSKDKEVVLFHDNKLTRINGSNESIENMNLEDIKRIDNGSYKSEKYANVQIVTLEEVFRNFRGRAKFNIELKVKNTNDYTLLSKVSELIRKYSMDSDVVVSSFNKVLIEKFKEDNAHIKIGYITSKPIDDVNELQCDFISVNYDMLSRELVEKIHNSQKEIYVWTINDDKQIKRAINLDVENIITDNVKLVKMCLG